MAKKSLDKTHPLGSGSYGAVYKARWNQLPCVAKIKHSVLSSREDPGSPVSLQKFQSECELLSLVRHPNIVQYLSTSFDEESRQPVLLMELCDENLTKFLERFPGPLPYHTELSISHDIALDLVYLHSNHLIHRDLSSNNVLMDGGCAKVTSFGMSKLGGTPSQTKTVCPSSMHYMPPEALDEPPSYTEKLDVFSFGVLLVQIMTRKFPDPGPRFRAINDPQYSTPIRVPIREVERRQAHLELINNSHPLKSLALQCLDDSEEKRPTAQDLAVRIEQLKEIEELKVTKSLPASLRNSPRPKMKTRPRSVEGHMAVEHEQVLHADRLEEQLEQVSLQLTGQRVLTNAAHKDLEKANWELQEEKKKMKQLLEKEEMRMKAIMEKDQRREKEMVEREKQWRKKRSDREKEMEKLKQKVEDNQEILKQLELEVSGLQRRLQREWQVLGGMFQTTTALPQKDITNLKWDEGERTPEPMSAGTAVTIGHNVFVNPASSKVVYCYNRVRKWSRLPPCPYQHFSLAVVNNILTTVGGLDDEHTNKLLSFTEDRGWTETLPPMPTPRQQPVTVSTEQHLIVAGGFNGLRSLDVVEALGMADNVWSPVCKLPCPLHGGSATLCANQIYIVPEVVESSTRQDVVLSCSIEDLFKPVKKSLFGKSGPWQRLKNIPAALSTIITLDGHILALGGKDMHAKNYTYTSSTVWEFVQGSWKHVSSMKIGRWSSIAAVLPEGQLMVVGGKSNWENMDSIEIATGQEQGVRIEQLREIEELKVTRSSPASLRISLLQEERKKVEQLLEKEEMRAKAIVEKYQRREMMKKEEKWKKVRSDKEKEMEKMKQELEDSKELFQQSLEQQASNAFRQLGKHKSGHTSSMIGQPKNLPAQKHVVPPYIKPTATLCHCTSQGIQYKDEWNDFTLRIPRGAIPEGESLAIDIGVALYGPFQYPEGLRPVSPVFWICVRDKKYFHFLKPVEVTLPHILTLDRQEDVQSLGLTFLKGDHEMRRKQKTHFQEAAGKALFRLGSDCGVLHTHHFCYLCIASKVSKETLQKAKFCIFATIPCVFAAHKPIYAFFFVTFLLKTCLETIKQQIRSIPDFPAGSFQDLVQDFHFANDVSEPALEIGIPHLHPAGWTLGLQFNTKITQSEVDFMEMDEAELELKENMKIYPPKFRVVITCSPGAQQNQARIIFKGAHKELVFDIPLLPQPSEPGTLPQQVPLKQKSTVLSSPVSLPDLLNHVAVRILSKWKMFGIQLDIPVSELDTYPSHNCLECYARVFVSWERKGSPELSWGTVITILESPIINERQLAEEVREKMASHTSSPSHTLL